MDQKNQPSGVMGIKSQENVVDVTAKFTGSQSTIADEINVGIRVETPPKFKSIIEAIEKMSVIDLHELVKHLETKFGVSAQAVAVPASAGSSGEAKEEKSTLNVELTDGGATKIAVIKVVKEVLGLGLKESKDLVDAAPSMLKEGMKKADAEEFQKKLTEAGAKVTLK